MVNLRWNTLSIAALAVILSATRPASAGARTTDPLEAALQRAAGFLVARQHADGSWRSDTYGTLRADLSLTPVVLSALHHLPRNGHPVDGAVERAVGLLLSQLDDHGQLQPPALAYPAYTAAAASWSVMFDGSTPRTAQAQSAWLALLLQRHCTEALGWRPEDAAYGGWGYFMKPPQRLALPPGEIEANLSVTVFAVGALRAAGRSTEEPIFAKILTFAGRCQNWPTAGSPVDDRFDDGGFFFSPSAPTRNKAGVSGRDPDGRQRFHSYGSTTADGLRILIRCGLGFGHPRVVAARRWLEHNFSALHNPGRFEPQRECLRDAYYYYYCWSVAHALMALGETTLDTTTGAVHWPSALADELVRRQNDDGSWTNPFTDAKEDDPLIATPLATAALAICQRMIARDCTGNKPTTQHPWPTTSGAVDLVEFAVRRLAHKIENQAFQSQEAIYEHGNRLNRQPLQSWVLDDRL